MPGRHDLAVTPFGYGDEIMPSRQEPARAASQRAVPWRIIFGTIGATVATLLALILVIKLQRILTWLAVAGFLAVGLAPPVAWVQRRLHLRRSLAILVVFVMGLGLVAGATYVVVRPLVSQAQDLADKLPSYIEDAQNGRGTVGSLVKRFNLDEWVQNNSDKVSSAISQSGKPALGIVRTVTDTVVSVVTVLVLTILLLMEAPGMIESGLGMLAPPKRKRVVRVAADCSRAISGYVAGNLLISVIAGAVTFVTLLALGVPFAAPLALWVAIADLIPLVGATLGAIPAVVVAFLHSTPAGIITLVVYILYQQFENHVLQVTIMSRTVSLNPLLVLVSVLVGVQLFGFVGALLAIPAAGVIQVVVRDIYHSRHGRDADADADADDTVTDVGAEEAASTLGISEDSVEQAGSADAAARTVPEAGRSAHEAAHTVAAATRGAQETSISSSARPDQASMPDPVAGDP
jgi:predicted PurR-regulated permease PerM